MMTPKLKEWGVSCEWCGAEIGKPCVNNITGEITEVYNTEVHNPRIQKYNEEQE